jgi:hypothetical protein
VNRDLEGKIRTQLFKIIAKLCQTLKSSTDSSIVFTVLQSLQWRYQARDFPFLVAKVELFPSLSKGGEGSLLEQCWCKVGDKHESLKLDLISTFADLFCTILARITDLNHDADVKSKQERVEMNLKR